CGLKNFYQFFEISPFFILSRKADYLLRNRASTATRIGGEVIPKCFGNGNRVKARMPIKIFIFKIKDTLFKAFRHRIHLWEPPLAIIGNSGTEHLAVAAFGNGGGGNIE